jgi:hypothetical protein
MRAALEAARGSFDAAHAAVTRRCGPVIGKRQLEPGGLPLRSAGRAMTSRIA